MIINDKILDELSAQAEASPWLRMNLNFHQGLDEKCHRFLNAVDPGSVEPIHHHPTKEEAFILLRGRLRVTTYHDDGFIIEDIILDPLQGRYGVNIGKSVCYTIQPLVPSVIFECKEGPFVPHEVEGIMLRSEK